jgi:uroporphyrinogen-III synthase
LEPRARAHGTSGSAADGIPPLAGYTVAVATDRRHHPLADLLESVGARVVGVQAVAAVPQPDPAELRASTVRCLADRCDEVVIASRFGLRRWLDVARTAGLADDLVARFATARLLSRDAAAADGLRDLGLTTIWSTAGATTEELLRYLMAQPLAGRRIVVQLDRPTLRDVCLALRNGGADVIEVVTYQPSPPPHAMILRRLLDLAVRRQVDAVAFAGAPAAGYLFAQAEREGRLAELRDVLRADIPCVALGPVSGRELAEQGVPVRFGERPYVEELAEALLSTLPRLALQLSPNGHRLEVRGHAVVVDGRFIPVPVGPLAVLRALASRPGQVLSASEIRRALPTGSSVDDHAVEMAVSRLRRALTGFDLVQTIVKRGYRLVV